MSDSPEPVALPRTAPALVGRDGELARLVALLDRDNGGTAVLVGEAGIGKTRLARHLVEVGASRGWEALSGRAGAADADLPLAPLRDALRANARAARDRPVPDDALAASFPGMLLPEMASPAAVDEPGRDVLFEAAARWIGAAADRSGLVLVLEDLHWADPSTHQLAHHLARALAGAPVALVLTFRPDEAPPGSSLDALRRDLARDRLADELRLGPLDASGVGALLAGIVGGDLEPALVGLFVEAGGGNPFVTEELLRAAIEGGHLAPSGAAWHGGRAPELPWSVADMVLSRVRRLAGPDRELLRWAAVAGEVVDPVLVGLAAGVDERALLSGLERARDAGLVRDDESGRMAFRHALTREAVLGALLAPDRRRRHGRLLAAGEKLAQDGSRVSLGQLLNHALEAGDRAKAFRYADLAARRSLELGGEPEALAHTERALGLWEGTDGEEARAELLLRQGRLLHRALQDHARAADSLDDARGAFAALGLHDRAALAAALRAGSRWWSGAPDALQELHEVRRALPGAAPIELRLEVLNEIARPMMLDGRPREAARLAEDGLALVPPAMSRRAGQERVSLLTTLGTCRFILGDLALGEATLAESARLAKAGDDPVGACRALHNVAFAVEDLHDMERYARAGLALSREHGLRPSERSFLIALCLCDAAAGRFAEAAERCARAEAVAGPWEGVAHTRLDVGLARGFLHWWRGEVREAREELAAVLGRLRGARESGTWTAQRGLALCCRAAGDLEAARDALAPALAGAEPGGYDRVLALVASAEVAAAEGDLTETARVAGELREVAPGHPGTPAAEALAAALAGGPGPAVLGAIETVARSHEAAGRRAAGALWRLSAAEALVHAGAGSEAVRLAERAREDLDAISADRWRLRAERLMRRLGRRVPGRSSGVGAGGLTARELEVLRLLTDGLSNRALAERLVISEKTAGRHVANVYLKLGVHSRVEAVREAGRKGLLDLRGEPERA